MLPVDWYLIVSAILFTIGVTGVLIRRNPLIIFMSIELMLNAVNLSFVTFSRYLDSVDGQMFVFLVWTAAAARIHHSWSCRQIYVAHGHTDGGAGRVWPGFYLRGARFYLDAGDSSQRAYE